MTTTQDTSNQKTLSALGVEFVLYDIRKFADLIHDKMEDTWQSDQATLPGQYLIDRRNEEADTVVFLAGQILRVLNEHARGDEH